MGFFSSLADNLLGAATIPCVCPVKMLDQLKKLIPLLPELPEIPIPKLDPLTPLTMAGPSAANNFIRSKLNIINKMRVPQAIARLPFDHMKIGRMESVTPVIRVINQATGANIEDPALEARMQGSLLGLAKIPLAVPTLATMPPPPQPIMQKVSAVVTQMRMAKAMLSLKLTPLDPAALAKIQVITKTVATIPPLPLEQLKPLAPLATVARLAKAMNVDLKKPGAVLKIANKLKILAKLPPEPPAPAMAALPAMMQVLSIAQTNTNVASYFKLDLAKLTPPNFIAKVGVPLQPLVEFGEQIADSLTPEQTANAQSWAAASQFFPALRLMETVDLGNLDLTPLGDVPPLPNFGPIASAFALGEVAKSAGKKAGSKKCPQCPLG
ncbi:hypothetical protein M2447_000611 [Ereboglobus sp. PH5-10]|uniref:hypothetical protein n=1 Tax=Ereboglobus sp. PH5-10 TaxID=2940629 RepID=UPI00240533ED|nr:hypothetical protein [Ereboglobus sp. PH5-10]MDF9826530.1 hypothetical protein [Ereboglobus sp. PH5-10]